MDRLSGFTQRLQSVGGPVAPDEIAQRVQLLYKRLKGTLSPSEKRWWTGQAGGGSRRIPTDLGKRAKRGVGAAFPFESLKGGGLLDGVNPNLMGLASGAPAMPDLSGAFNQAAPGAGALFGQAKGFASALSSGNLGALPKSQGPSLTSFLESQGVPVIPIQAKKTPGDFLGNTARWWVKAAASPYLGTLVKVTFFFMFFISYLESVPFIGSVLSVALDVILAGGRILVKILQKGVPTLIGLIPLPYSQFAGVALVSVLGMFVWTILATISFGRQDFTSAIDSMLRVIPMPIGDALADSFLDMNRTWDQFNEKRIKLVDDIWNGMQLVQQFIEQAAGYFKSTASDAYARVQSGSNTLMSAIRGMRESPPPPFVPGASPFQEIPTVVQGAPPVVQGEIPTATPVLEAPIPTAPPMDVPVAPVTQEAPAPGAPPPAPAPVVPVPTAPAPPPEIPTAMPVPEAPKLSALDRLRSQKTAYTAPKQLQGGKKLSTKTRKQRKWTTYERFFGAGLR